MSFTAVDSLIKAVEAVQNGLTEEYAGDDLTEEVGGHQVGGGSSESENYFVIFTVYKSDACKVGDEVYSMSGRWKKLKSFVDDCTEGHSAVRELYQKLFDRYVKEEDIDLLVGGANRRDTKKIVRMEKGTLVPVGGEKLNNVAGSSKDRRKIWIRAYYELNPKAMRDWCFIESAKPPCDHTDPLEGNIDGGHVWSPDRKVADGGKYYYILPICKQHNKSKTYDETKNDSGWLKATKNAKAMKIETAKNVPGWGRQVNNDLVPSNVPGAGSG